MDFPSNYATYRRQVVIWLQEMDQSRKANIAYDTDSLRHDLQTTKIPERYSFYLAPFSHQHTNVKIHTTSRLESHEYI
jgi:hypothetical protein